MILGVDISKYQEPVNLDLMDIDFIIAKSSQGDYAKDRLFDTYYEQMKRKNILMGAYHWFDPLRDVNKQYDYIMTVLQDKEFDFFALDIEQYWESWGEWENNNITRFIDPYKISEYGRRLAEKMKSNFEHVLIYTRASFVDEYASPMKSWMKDYKLWYASYPYKKGTVNVTWQELRDSWLPTGEILFPKKYPEDLKNYIFWQFSGDKFIVPGCTKRIDLNLFRGTREELYSIFKKDVVEEPEYTLEEKVNILWEEYISKR
jgi:lysozyme